MAPFSAALRPRKVVASRVSRFISMGTKLTSARGAFLIGDIDDAAPDRGRAHVALDIIAAHHVQDHIDALAVGLVP